MKEKLHCSFQKRETPNPPGLGDLAVAVLVHDEFSGLAGGVDNKRVAVEPLQHDGVLCAQLITGQCVGLPAQSLISV